jgi:putative FmdB family regulatory protein
MPIYEFQCKKCNGVIEEIRCVTDRSRPAECPACSPRLGYTVSAEPIMSAPAPQFPGASGWQR